MQVRIRGRQATVRIDQAVRNDGTTPVETRNLWPAPAGIEVRDFRYTVNGAATAAARVEGEKADQVYKNAAQDGDDPRVLRYLGRPFFESPGITIPAGGRVAMRMEYSAELPVEQGVVRFQHPLSTNGFSQLPINRAALRVSIQDQQPIGFFYSPTHAFRWTTGSGGSVEGNLVETNRRMESDLLLYFAPGADPVDVRLLSHRREGMGGTFLVSVRPGPTAESTVEYVPRDLVFVLDRSGSMAGGKLDQARAGLEFSLSRLNPKDRFSLIWYDTDVHVWRPELQEAGEADVAAAREALRALRPAGSTNIHGALTRALQLLGKGERPAAVIFLTDGLPTAGVTDISRIRTDVQEANNRKARIFVFGVGYDVNVPFLDHLSSENRGDAEYVRPGDNLEARMAAFYEKQAQPILTDLQLALEGVETLDVYPADLPDLFVNGEVLVVGRYRKPGNGTLRLTGLAGAASQTVQKRFRLPEREPAFDFLPRLWAQRRIGFLLDEVRLRGPKPELLQQITELSREFGILTDYTRSLVDDRVSLDLRSQSAALSTNAARAGGFASGAFATSQSVNNRGLRQQAQVYQNRFLDESGAEVELNQTRQAGNRSQFLRGGYWTDVNWPADQAAIRIKRFSKAYWELLRRKPELAETLAAGRRVRFLLGKQPVQVGDDGATELSAADRMKLFGVGVGLFPAGPRGWPGIGLALGGLLAAGISGVFWQRRCR